MSLQTALEASVMEVREHAVKARVERYRARGMSDIEIYSMALDTAFSCGAAGDFSIGLFWASVADMVAP